MGVHAGNHLRLLQSSERTLAQAMESVGRRHDDQPDAPAILRLMATWSYDHADRLTPILARYPGVPATSPRMLAAVLFKGPRKGSIGFLRDLQDLAILTHATHGNWSVADQIAAATRDDELKARCDADIEQTLRQLDWVDARIKELAPQALTVPQ